MPGPHDHVTAIGHALALALEVDGVRITMLTEVSGLVIERDVVEMKQTAPDGSYVIKRLPGRRKPGELTLTRGLTADRTFEQWARDASLGPGGAAHSAAVVVLDLAGSPVVTYSITNAWPRRLEVTGLRSGGSEGLLEHLVLVYDDLRRA